VVDIVQQPAIERHPLCFGVRTNGREQERYSTFIPRFASLVNMIFQNPAMAASYPTCAYPLDPVYLSWWHYLRLTSARYRNVSRQS
jgi:hypothetical protein